MKVLAAGAAMIVLVLIAFAAHGSQLTLTVGGTRVTLSVVSGARL